MTEPGVEPDARPAGGAQAKPGTAGIGTQLQPQQDPQRLAQVQLQQRAQALAPGARGEQLQEGGRGEFAHVDQDGRGVVVDHAAEAALQPELVLAQAQRMALRLGDREHAAHVLPHPHPCRMQFLGQHALQCGCAARARLQQREVAQHAHLGPVPAAQQRGVGEPGEGVQAGRRAGVTGLHQALCDAVLFPGLEQQGIQRVVQQVEQAARSAAPLALFVEQVLGVVDRKRRRGAVQTEAAGVDTPVAAGSALHAVHLVRSDAQVEHGAGAQLRGRPGTLHMHAEKPQQAYDLEVLEARALALQLPGCSIGGSAGSTRWRSRVSMPMRVIG